MLQSILSRIANCQVGIFLAYSGARGYTLLDRELCRDSVLKSRERDPVEVLLLLADDLRVSQLARHFGCCAASVWCSQHRTEAGGLKSLRHWWWGLRWDVARRQAVHRALNELVGARYVRTQYVLITGRPGRPEETTPSGYRGKDLRRRKSAAGE